jgi:serine/threonine protein kinase/class 3 adenylate cyclase
MVVSNETSKIRSDMGSSGEDYRIVSQIATSSSGLWYRAVRSSDGSPLDVLVLNDLNPDQRERVTRRVSLVSRLRHPSVASVLDVKLVGDDQSCVLEPLPTRSLAMVAEEFRRHGSAKLLSCASQIASAVSAGHRLGLVHGQISPSTIRIGHDDTPQIDYLRLVQEGETRDLATDDTRFSAPEFVRLDDADAAADAFSLASVLLWLFAGRTPTPDIDRASLERKMRSGLSDVRLNDQEIDDLILAIEEALALDPSERCSSHDLCERLERMAARLLSDANRLDLTAEGRTLPPGAMDVTGALEWSASDKVRNESKVDSGMHDQLGRFRILNKLGEGGMGEVYKAQDVATDQVVAIKVLRRQYVGDRQAVRRFQKEARLLGEIKSPFITNLVEVNQENGLHYLVMEFVSGFDLSTLIRKSAPFAERVALSLVADIARGLASAHERGIVHRDIKPANVLLAYEPLTGVEDSSSVKLDERSFKRFRVKLSDFGLAREIEQSASMLITRAGVSVGTPIYMSPEQFKGDTVTPASDVYSLGITLYELLAGKPPFVGGDVSQLINKHCNESPPPLQSLDHEISDATRQVVHRAIAKSPNERFSDAGQLLREIERLLRGEANSVEAHPQLPGHDPGQVFEEVFQWDLQGSASDLWPHVSNTERINSAVGVPSVKYATKRDDQGRLRKFGEFRMAGLQIGWEEHPFEWVEGQRLGILREFHQGPFVWFLSIVELIPRVEGGTRLRHTVRILPRGLMGRLVATMEVRVKGKRNLDRVYRRIDRSVTGGLAKGPRTDPFADAPSLSTIRRQTLDERLDRLAERGIDPNTIDCLGQFLREAPAQELGRIRPIALARTFSIQPDRMIAACLAAAKEGLLDLHWDILCPTCRVSSQVANTLRAIEDHANCEVCDLDFEVDLAKSVEMIFRANPEVRSADTGTYCIGGPEHSPHVVLQLRLPPGKRVELTPLLSEGQYSLRSAQLPYNYLLRAMPGRGTTHTEIVLSSNSDSARESQVRAGRNTLTITNDFDREIVVRLERRIPRMDVLTAAQASSLPLFRELFPDEAPHPERFINVSTITLFAIDILKADGIFDGQSDVEVYEMVRQFRSELQRLAQKHAGTVVHSVGSEFLLAFDKPVEVVALAEQLAKGLRSSDRKLNLCAAIHRGTALATSSGDQLDYFGGTVHQVRRLLQHAAPGELWMTEAVASDPSVVQAIQERGLRSEFVDLPNLGRRGARCQRVILA